MVYSQPSMQLYYQTATKPQKGTTVDMKQKKFTTFQFQRPQQPSSFNLQKLIFPNLPYPLDTNTQGRNQRELTLRGGIFKRSPEQDDLLASKFMLRKETTSIRFSHDNNLWVTREIGSSGSGFLKMKVHVVPFPFSNMRFYCKGLGRGRNRFLLLYFFFQLLKQVAPSLLYAKFLLSSLIRAFQLFAVAGGTLSFFSHKTYTFGCNCCLHVCLILV